MDFVVETMKGQTREGGDKACSHPLRVGLELANALEDHDTIIAGILHDIVEDSPVTLKEIRYRYGKCVADIVGACTADDYFKDTKKRNNDLYRRVKNCGRGAVVVKLADNADNLLSCGMFKRGRHQRYLRQAKKWQKLGQEFLTSAHPIVSTHADRLHEELLLFINIYHTEA